MRVSDDSVRNIIKGLQGLEMLGQWQQCLVRDLHAKAEALLDAARDDKASDSPSSRRPTS